MGDEIKATRDGTVGVRYARGCNLDRIRKIYDNFGKSIFTIRDVRNGILPDMNSGEICKWSTAGIITSVGYTKWDPKQSIVKTWRLSGNVVSKLEKEEKNG